MSRVAFVTAGVDPFAVKQVEEISGKPYWVVPLAPPNAHTAISVAERIVDRALVPQERTVITLCASRWRSVVVAADHLRGASTLEGV